MPAKREHVATAPFRSRRIVKPLLTALVLVTLAITGSARAAGASGCFERSPLLESLADRYYAVDVPRSQLPLAPPELNLLADNSFGDWSGVSSGFDCRGTDGDPRAVPRHAEIAASFSGGAQEGIFVAYTRFRPDQKVTSQDSLVLFHPNNLLHFEVTGPQRAVGSERFRQGTAEGLSVLRETASRLALRDGRLSLERDYYVNGVLVGRENWDLSRD